MIRVIYLSKGLETTSGCKLIKKKLSKEMVKNKKIYIFCGPYSSRVQDMKASCKEIGFCEKDIFTSETDLSAEKLADMDYIYVTGGNTFDILKKLRNKKLLEPIRWAVQNGTTYIGSSAGAIIAGKDVALASDRNYTGLKGEELEGLNLFNGTIIPHCSAKKFEEDREFYESVRDRYPEIYRVSDDEIRILEINNE